MDKLRLARAERTKKHGVYVSDVESVIAGLEAEVENLTDKLKGVTKLRKDMVGSVENAGNVEDEVVADFVKAELHGKTTTKFTDALLQSKLGGSDGKQVDANIARFLSAEKALRKLIGKKKVEIKAEHDAIEAETARYDMKQCFSLYEDFANHTDQTSELFIELKQSCLGVNKKRPNHVSLQKSCDIDDRMFHQIITSIMRLGAIPKKLEWDFVRELSRLKMVPGNRWYVDRGNHNQVRESIKKQRNDRGSFAQKRDNYLK